MRIKPIRRPAKAAAPPPMPDRPAPPLLVSRTLLIGAVGVALPILVHAILLPVLGEGTTPLFIVFLISLLPASGVAIFCSGLTMLRMGYAMCLVIGAAFLSLSLHEARIFGPVPGLDAAAAPGRPAAAGFLLAGAAPRADLARDVQARITLPRRDMRGRSASMPLRGRFTVVPVVSPDWTPAQPVSVVAVLDHGPDRPVQAVRSAPWDAGRGVLRLLPDPLRDQAVRQALVEAGWTAAPHIVAGRWVADPRWARLDAAMPLLWLFAMAWLGLALVILSRHPWIAERAAPATAGMGGPVPMVREILAGMAALTLPSLVALALRHAGVDVGIMMLAIAFAIVPSLMMAIGASRATTPVGVMIAGVILIVALPMAVAARGAGPNGDLPSLAGARWADVQEAMIVLGVGWLAWAVLVVAGRVFGRAAR